MSASRGELKAIFIVVDTSMSVSFDAAGDQNFYSINLIANVPWMWHAGSGINNPFTDDVTAMHFASTAGARRVKVVILVDT